MNQRSLRIFLFSCLVFLLSACSPRMAELLGSPYYTFGSKASFGIQQSAIQRIKAQETPLGHLRAENLYVKGVVNSREDGRGGYIEEWLVNSDSGPATYLIAFNNELKKFVLTKAKTTEALMDEYEQSRQMSTSQGK